MASVDGYPRSLDLVDVLDTALAEAGLQLDHVVELTADTDEVVARLLNRAKEQGRADDTEQVIRRRLQAYVEQTEPLTRVYEQKGVLRRVDGMGTIDHVRDRILAAL